METDRLTYNQLETRVAQWAQTQPAIRAVIAVGSRARPDYPADRWSDLDVIIFTTERAAYTADSGWLTTFGAVILSYLDETDPGDPEWYTLYEGGLKLDAALVRVEDPTLDLETLLALHPYQGVISRGVSVLFDRNASPRQLPPKPLPLRALPTAAEFDKTIRGFFLAITTTAKRIARGELWRAQEGFSQNLRRYLLRMIEWHAYGKDTWYSARFIEHWADPRILAALPQAFPALERASLQTSLWALLDLFRWIAGECAARFGFSYPTYTHEQIVALTDSIFRESI